MDIFSVSSRLVGNISAHFVNPKVTWYTDTRYILYISGICVSCHFSDYEMRTNQMYTNMYILTPENKCFNQPLAARHDKRKRNNRHTHLLNQNVSTSQHTRFSKSHAEYYLDFHGSVALELSKNIYFFKVTSFENRFFNLRCDRSTSCTCNLYYMKTID